MARNSKAKTTRQGLSGQPDTQDIWGNGAKRLIDQGKLMWMLGEGLKAVHEDRARGWSPVDEQRVATGGQGNLARSADSPQIPEEGGDVDESAVDRGDDGDDGRRQGFRNDGL